MDKDQFLKKWDFMHKKLTGAEKLFFEIMSFGFIGTHAEESDIEVSKTTGEVFKDGKSKRVRIYTVMVPLDD